MCRRIDGMWSDITTASRPFPEKRLLNAADSSTKSTSSTRSFSAFRRAKLLTLTRSIVLLLETSWEAIENGGIVLDFEKGSDNRCFRWHFAQ